MICQDQAARSCAGVDIQRVRIQGDSSGRAHTLCRDCRAHYEGTPFHFTWIRADAPEPVDHRPPWMRRVKAKDLTEALA